MKNINKEKQKEALTKLIEDLEKRIEKGWYGEVILTMKKGVVEGASFTDTKRYI